MDLQYCLVMGACVIVSTTCGCEHDCQSSCIVDSTSTCCAGADGMRCESRAVCPVLASMFQNVLGRGCLLVQQKFPCTKPFDSADGQCFYLHVHLARACMHSVHAHRQWHGKQLQSFCPSITACDTLNPNPEVTKGFGLMRCNSICMHAL